MHHLVRRVAEKSQFSANQSKVENDVGPRIAITQKKCGVFLFLFTLFLGSTCKNLATSKILTLRSGPFPRK